MFYRYIHLLIDTILMTLNLPLLILIFFHCISQHCTDQIPSHCQHYIDTPNFLIHFLFSLLLPLYSLGIISAQDCSHLSSTLFSRSLPINRIVDTPPCTCCTSTLFFTFFLYILQIHLPIDIIPMTLLFLIHCILQVFSH